MDDPQGYDIREIALGVTSTPHDVAQVHANSLPITFYWRCPHCNPHGQLSHYFAVNDGGEWLTYRVTRSVHPSSATTGQSWVGDVPQRPQPATAVGVTLLSGISQEDWEQALKSKSRQGKHNYPSVVLGSDYPGVDIKIIPLVTPINPKTLEADGWQSRRKTPQNPLTVYSKTVRPTWTTSYQNEHNASVQVWWGDDSPGYLEHTPHPDESYTVWVLGQFVPNVVSIEQLNLLVDLFIVKDRGDRNETC